MAPSHKAPHPLAATPSLLLLFPTFFTINTFMHPFHLWFPLFFSLGAL